MASVVLQRGSTTLVTSSNPRALEALVGKLHPKLRMFCIDMASIEEGGMTALCRALECMQSDLAELMGGRDGFEKDVEVRSIVGVWCH